MVSANTHALLKNMKTLSYLPPAELYCCSHLDAMACPSFNVCSNGTKHSALVAGASFWSWWFIFQSTYSIYVSESRIGRISIERERRRERENACWRLCWKLEVACTKNVLEIGVGWPLLLLTFEVHNIVLTCYMHARTRTPISLLCICTAHSTYCTYYVH